MPLQNLVARGSFSPDAVEMMAAVFESLLVTLEISRDDPLAQNVALAVVNAAASGITDSKELQARAFHMLFPDQRVA
jgi:hypothetical protein